MSSFWRRFFTVEAVVLLSTIVGATEYQEGVPNGRTAAAAIKKPLLGYQLDISRDKVPTMKTLYRIVDLLAACGYNCFQLYMEHTFAYKGHEEAWANASPLTAEEIRALDDYCAERGIELVPNQNSFGHLEKWLELPRYRQLAEVPGGGFPKKGTTMWLKQAHALCPTDPKAFEFIISLWDDLTPNFRSKMLTIHCDEVWDLESDGHGRSWQEVMKKGSQYVWLDFVKKLCAAAEQRGRTVLLDDDMFVRHYPELISKLPSNVIAIDWNYGRRPPGKDFAATTLRLKEAGIPYVVQCGTSGWTSLTGRHANMTNNVREGVTYGRQNGALGFIMSEWGDGGHCQPWITTLPALVYLSHAVKDEWIDDVRLATEVDRLTGTVCGQALLRYQNLYLLDGKPEAGYMSELYRRLSQGEQWMRPDHGMTDEDMKAIFAEWQSAKDSLDLKDAPDWVRDGFATMDLLLESLKLRWKGEHERVRCEMPPRYRALWLRHNRPGGLDDSVKQVFSR